MKTLHFYNGIYYACEKQTNTTAQEVEFNQLYEC